MKNDYELEVWRQASLGNTAAQTRLEELRRKRAELTRTASNTVLIKIRGIPVNEFRLGEGDAELMVKLMSQMNDPYALAPVQSPVVVKAEYYSHIHPSKPASKPNRTVTSITCKLCDATKTLGKCAECGESYFCTEHVCHDDHM
jgi:hypothetical protein